ncbi:MAG: AraC family transcriptional regulator [Alistipes sp.]|nr:AraC family transcriptional regulator [Alistipes sp.]
MTKQNIFSYYAEILRGVKGAKVLDIEGALMLHLDHIDREQVQALRYPCRIDAMVMVVCVQGEVSFSSHMSDYTLKAGQSFVSSASVFQFHSVANSEFYALAFESSFLTSMNVDMRFILRMVSQLRINASVSDVSKDSMCIIQDLFGRILADYSVKPLSECMEASLRHLFCALIYRISDAIIATNYALPTMGVKERSSEYFERLMVLLADNFREQRNVEFYAEKMNISSKHLSRVIRNYTGKSVHQWIDEFVALEIKNLLKYSNMSIQQISFELNFPNPSFMGQYFKRITGQTPGEYKKS